MASEEDGSVITNIPEELLCSICQDLYCAAVSTTVCQHSYCSHCIRLDVNLQLKSLKKWICCPCCRAQLFPRGISKVDKVLKPNLEVQQQVYDFKKKSHHHRNGSSGRNPPLTPHPRVVYQGKKRRDFIEMLVQHRLPAHGSEDELKTRYERFVLCWNSFCDERIDPPTADFVKRYFVSHLTAKAAMSSSKRSKVNTKKNKFGKEFQDLHSKIQQEFAHKWSQDNFSLAILANQRHPILQDLSFREELRNRAMNATYTNTKISQLLQESPRIDTSTAFANNAAAAAAKPTQVPETNDSVDNNRKQSKPSKSTMVARPTKWTTNPYTRKGPATRLRTAATAAVTQVSTTPIETKKRPLPTTRIDSTTAAAMPAVPSPVVLDVNPPKARSYLAAPSATSTPAPKTQPPSVSSATRSRSYTAPTTQSSPAAAAVVTVTKKHRTAVTNSSKPPSFPHSSQRQSNMDKNWHWSCQICTYEMKLDRKATKCAFCGASKGKSFDEVHNENNNNQNDNNCVMGSSPENPIQMFY